MKKSAGKARGRRARGLFVFIPLWLLLIGMTAGLAAVQSSRYGEAKRELERAEEDLRREKQLHEELLGQRAYYESDAYVEQLAREMLDYVRPDEIVFQNIAD